MTPHPKIYVAGHKGMVGSAIVRQLLAQGQPAERIVTRVHAELDLTNQAAASAFFAPEKPDQVYLAAAKVDGIHVNNTYPADKFGYVYVLTPTGMAKKAVITHRFLERKMDEYEAVKAEIETLKTETGLKQ